MTSPGFTDTLIQVMPENHFLASRSDIDPECGSRRLEMGDITQTRPDGPLADRRGYPRPETIAAAMVLVCPMCAGDRVIPLTFETVIGEMLAQLPERPIAKCASCGHRLTAREVTAQERSSPT